MLENEVDSLKETLQMKEDLRSKAASIVKQTNEFNSERVKFRVITLQLCDKMMKESFRITDKLREQQNAALTKQLDDLSCNDESSASVSIMSEDVDAEDKLMKVNSLTAERDTSEKMSQNRESDPNVIWQIHPQNIFPKSIQLHVKRNNMQKNFVSTSMIG